MKGGQGRQPQLHTTDTVTRIRVIRRLQSPGISPDEIKLYS